MRVSEIHVKWIRVNQGLGVYWFDILFDKKLAAQNFLTYITRIELALN